MSDRVTALTVYLDHDVRQETADELTAAIKQFKYVLDVKQEPCDNLANRTAEMRVRADLSTRLFEVLYPKSTPRE